MTEVKDGATKEPLYEFIRSVEKTFYQSGLALKEPHTWMKAF